jgi:2,5-diamino-6-(ribosylamino)-4(3H)-pyrimidinone 5'-phosphate reductase
VSPMPERPRVVANCAASADGRLAFAGGARARMSGPNDLARVHRLRADSDAILVGITTVLRDDPSLTVKWELAGRPVGRPPLRVVLDSRGRVPPNARILDGAAPTLVATAAGVERRFDPPAEGVALGEDRVDLPRLLSELSRRGVRQLMVEGGGRVLSSFLRGGFVDELSIYLAPILIGGTTAPALLEDPAGPMAPPLELELVGAEPIDEGLLVRYRPRSPEPL